MLLIAAALCLGPWRALRSGRRPFNDMRRRDLGIWAALTGLLHLAVATAVVMRPAYVDAYIRGTAEAPLAGLVTASGTAAILGGYLVGLLCLLLLALSSNYSVRRLGPRRWKRLQGSAIAAFLLTVLHGLAFQVLEGRTGPWVAALVLVTAAVFLLRWRARGIRVAAPG